MITEMIPIRTRQGITYVSAEGLANELGELGANAAASIATGAGTAASIVTSSLATTLFTSAAAAQALPIVGQVLGGIALVAGFLASSYAKTKAIKEQGTEVDKKQIELIVLNAELDGMLKTASDAINNINSELLRLGISQQPLNGFADFLKKTFTPAKYEQSKLDDKVANYNALLAQVELKEKTLKQWEVQLNDLYERLTGGKNLQKTLLIGGSIAVGLASLYLLNQKYKWLKL